jgi:hypothetical protein
MSTRCTIAYDDDFHLYEECLDTDSVYLCLDGGGWEASLSTNVIDWDDENKGRPCIRLKISIDLWRKIAEGWQESSWSKHPERDHAKSMVNLDERIALINNMFHKENKEDE